MKEISDESIDLVVTSPPYDNLRDYNGYVFDFENVAMQLYRILKQGGVIVWIVNDATIDGTKTGTSFRQALYFKEIGFNIHDVMIWEKNGFTATGSLQIRYAPVFEYMFIFSKGKPKTFNPIKDRRNISFGNKKSGTIRQKDGSMKHMSNIGKPYTLYGQRYNIWKINSVGCTQEGTGHPAQFPFELARDHIISWSDEGDVVLDCFLGSGTTADAAIQTKRHYIGFEISEEYFEISKQRIADSKQIAKQITFDEII
jgi:site-specific DNA-methyltransferase (adenine-specific)